LHSRKWPLVNPFTRYLMAVAFVTIATIAACHVCVWTFYRSPVGENLWIWHCIIKKERIGRNISGPKIVITGGSSALFGVRTKDIQAELGIPSVNLAVHAALDIDYMVYRAKRVLQTGDMVIIPLELSQFAFDGKPDYRKASFLLTYDRDYFLSQPLYRQLQCTRQVDLWKLPEAIRLSRRYARSEPAETEVGKGYNSATLNENGDETFNQGNPRTKAIAGSLKSFPLPGGRFGETYALRQIVRFNEWCVERGITFYISYASTLYFPEYENPAYRSYFSKLRDYFAKKKVPVLGTPYDYLFESRFMYDTIYHLNREGTTIRTRQLIRMIAPMVREKTGEPSV
jgi:hypothetical protein